MVLPCIVAFPDYNTPMESNKPTANMLSCKGINLCATQGALITSLCSEVNGVISFVRILHSNVSSIEMKVLST